MKTSPSGRLAADAENGFALVLALFVVMAVMVLGIAIITVSMMNQETSSQVSISQQNFQIADGGAELGVNWLKQYALPPELDSTLASKAPLSGFTNYTNNFNPINPATGLPFQFPQYKYRVTFQRIAPVSAGVSLTVGETYVPVQPYWHYYEIESMSRSGRTAALGVDKFDRAIVMVVRSLYYH